MDISLLVRTIILSMTILAGTIVLRFSRQEDIQKLHNEVMQRHDIDMEFYLIGEDCCEDDTKCQSQQQRQAEMALDMITTTAINGTMSTA